jgi:2-polyprenyl-3-methyl-5-hydroxy-6-metoxy-1,4-benzoquinol methylase
VRDDAAQRVASRFRSRFLKHYVSSKLATDPLYRGVAARLDGHTLPVTDIGCGVGLMAFYLRERGVSVPMTGLDHDRGKIETARHIAASYEGLTFTTADARDPIRAGTSVLLLDVLHYFSDSAQARMLETIAAGVPDGGLVIIREALRDGSMRYRITMAAEMFARVVRWLKAERLNFPARETIVQPFRERGFSEEIVPLWGRTPFNNYLFVFRRAASGSTKR